MARRSPAAGGNRRESGMRYQPTIFVAVVLMFFGIIVSRLFWLQIIQGQRYRQLSVENRIRLMARSPIRGRLLDRN